jgi:hypothetical protein
MIVAAGEGTQFGGGDAQDHSPPGRHVRRTLFWKVDNVRTRRRYIFAQPYPTDDLPWFPQQRSKTYAWIRGVGTVLNANDTGGSIVL